MISSLIFDLGNKSTIDAYVKLMFSFHRHSDIDGDGLLDDEEFALAMHLIHIKIEGHQIPEELPSHLIPPRYRPKQNGFTLNVD